MAPLGNVAAADTVAAALIANEAGGADMNTTAVGWGGPGAGPLSDPPQPEARSAQPDARTAMSTQTIRCFILSFFRG